MRLSLHAVPGAHGHKDGTRGQHGPWQEEGRRPHPPAHLQRPGRPRRSPRAPLSSQWPGAARGCPHGGRWAGSASSPHLGRSRSCFSRSPTPGPRGSQIPAGPAQREARDPGPASRHRTPSTELLLEKRGFVGVCAATGLPSGHVPPPTPPRTFPASVSLSIKHKRLVIAPASHLYPQGHWAMPAALGGTGGKGRSEQRRGHLGACCLPALGCSPQCQPSRSRPCPWRAPGSHLSHSELTSLPTSKLCPHAGHFTTSEPRSFVSRPGARITRASWGAMPSILLQPRQPPPPGSLPTASSRKPPSCAQRHEPRFPWAPRLWGPLHLFICSSRLSVPTLGHDVPGSQQSPQCDLAHSPWKNQMWPWASSKAASTGLGSPCQWREASAG